MRPNDREKTVIGITGGIGSGKSTVLDYIRKRCRCHVIFADRVGKDLMKPGRSVYKAIVSAYGASVLREDGSIDTEALTKEAFKDEESILKLNAIEHPLIKKEILRRIRITRKKLVFVEAALLQEGDLVPVCDEVWVVTAQLKTRILRLCTSRGYSEEKAEAFIRRQLSDAQFETIADRLIPNDGPFEETAKEIDACLLSAGADIYDAV